MLLRWFKLWSMLVLLPRRLSCPFISPRCIAIVTSIKYDFSTLSSLLFVCKSVRTPISIAAHRYLEHSHLGCRVMPYSGATWGRAVARTERICYFYFTRKNLTDPGDEIEPSLGVRGKNIVHRDLNLLLSIYIRYISNTDFIITSPFDFNILWVLNKQSLYACYLFH